MPIFILSHVVEYLMEHCLIFVWMKVIYIFILYFKKRGSSVTWYHHCSENIFEDGNNLYRFLEHDPVVISQCYNIPRGTIDVKPKSLTEIASRLRFLSYAIFEAYVSEDGRHVDYGSLYGTEEFKRLVAVINWNLCAFRDCRSWSVL